MKKVMWVMGIMIVIAAMSIMFLQNRNTVDGKIIAIDNIGRIITIKNNDQIIDLKVTDHTTLYDISDHPALFSDFNVGFEITALLNKSNDTTIIRKIKITNSPNIIIITPENNSVVKNSFKIQGVARVFENVLQVQIIDKKTGQIIFNSPVTAKPLDIGLFGPFEVTVDFPYQNDMNKIEASAFQYSAKDGSITDKTTITLEVVK